MIVSPSGRDRMPKGIPVRGENVVRRLRGALRPVFSFTRQPGRHGPDSGTLYEKTPGWKTFFADTLSFKQLSRHDRLDCTYNERLKHPIRHRFSDDEDSHLQQPGKHQQRSFAPCLYGRAFSLRRIHPSTTSRARTESTPLGKCRREPHRHLGFPHKDFPDDGAVGRACRRERL